MSILTFVREEKGQPIMLDGIERVCHGYCYYQTVGQFLGRGKFNWVNLSQLKKPGPLIRAHGSG